MKSLLSFKIFKIQVLEFLVSRVFSTVALITLIISASLQHSLTDWSTFKKGIRLIYQNLGRIL